jgi:hypothetical protein
MPVYILLRPYTESLHSAKLKYQHMFGHAHVPIHVYILLFPYTPYTYLILLCPYTSTCLHTTTPILDYQITYSTPIYLYMFTYAYTYIALHVKILLCPRIYASKIILRPFAYTCSRTSTLLYLCLHETRSMFIYFYIYVQYIITYIYANIRPIHTYVLLRI